MAFKEYEHILVSVEDRVATVELNRKDKRNALSAAHMEELTDVALELNRNVHIAAAILTGGESFFSAGADLTDPRMRERAKLTKLEHRHALRIGPDMCDAWEAVEAYTIAAIEGFCIGGGAALALGCDRRIIGKSGYLRLPEIPLGMNMSWHSIPRIVSLVGAARAKEFVIFGEPLSAQDAEQWGMVEDVTDDGGTLACAQSWANKVRKLPPIPVRMSKESINGAANALHQATTFMDRDQYFLASLTDDSSEAIRAFLEKRDPEFKGD